MREPDPAGLDHDHACVLRRGKRGRLRVLREVGESSGYEVVKALWERKLRGRAELPPRFRHGSRELEREEGIAVRRLRDADQQRPRRRLGEPVAEEMVERGE